MQHKLLDTVEGHRHFLLVLETGDDVMQNLQQFADAQNLRAAHFSAIGAFQDVVLGWFDWQKRDYKRIPLNEQVEVLSLLGDITADGTRHKIHAHVVVGTSEAIARGGHLLEAHVRPTLEIFLEESPTKIHRAYDPLAQIPLITTR